MTPLQSILKSYHSTPTGRNTSPAPRRAAPSSPRNRLRPHQTSAKTTVHLGFKSADRGKLIMACGTGKTFTSLKIAEEIAGKDKRVLFIVPSLNLLSQTLTEWTQESAIPLHSFAVFSDAKVGKKRSLMQRLLTSKILVSI